MSDRRISILGTEYKVLFKSSSEDCHLIGAGGYCDPTSRVIVIKTNNDNNLGNFERARRKALRHEIIHAFLSESGLQSNFQHCDEFGHDETMVDWFAIQFPKIHKVYKELGIEGD